jgi:hypothetical protein
LRTIPSGKPSEVAFAKRDFFTSDKLFATKTSLFGCTAFCSKTGEGLDLETQSAEMITKLTSKNIILPSIENFIFTSKIEFRLMNIQ